MMNENDYVMTNIKNFAFSISDFSVLEEGLFSLKEGSFCNVFCVPICGFCINVRQEPEN